LTEYSKITKELNAALDRSTTKLEQNVSQLGGRAAGDLTYSGLESAMLQISLCGSDFAAFLGAHAGEKQLCDKRLEKLRAACATSIDGSRSDVNEAVERATADAVEEIKRVGADLAALSRWAKAGNVRLDGSIPSDLRKFLSWEPRSVPQSLPEDTEYRKILYDVKASGPSNPEAGSAMPMQSALGGGAVAILSWFLGASFGAGVAIGLLVFFATGTLIATIRANFNTKLSRLDGAARAETERIRAAFRVRQRRFESDHKKWCESFSQELAQKESIEFAEMAQIRSLIDAELAEVDRRLSAAALHLQRLIDNWLGANSAIVGYLDDASITAGKVLSPRLLRIGTLSLTATRPARRAIRQVVAATGRPKGTNGAAATELIEVIRSPLSGTVRLSPPSGTVFPSLGDQVAEGQTLLAIEIDGQNHPIPSPFAGRLVELLVKEGQVVTAADALARLDLVGGQSVESDGGGYETPVSFPADELTDEQVICQTDEQGEQLLLQSFGNHTPMIETVLVPVDKIHDVIGLHHEIKAVSDCRFYIGYDGVIKIASLNAESIRKAHDMIWSIIGEPEEGKIYTGKVVKLVDFGAFVNFFGKRDGLVHVSQIASKRLNHPNEALEEGQEVKVKFLGFDERGKVRLGMKMVDQETGEEIQ